MSLFIGEEEKKGGKKKVEDYTNCAGEIKTISGRVQICFRAGGQIHTLEQHSFTISYVYVNDQHYSRLQFVTVLYFYPK